MDVLRSAVSRCMALFRRRELDERIDEELHFHIEMQTEENVRRGMSLAEARRRARIRTGGVEQVKEECRDVWQIGGLEVLWRDLRYAARMLTRSPGFTLVAALTLAVGIGLSTAIFSVVNSVLLAPLPYEAADRLVQVIKRNPTDGSLMEYLTGLDFLEYRDGAPAFDAITCLYAYSPTGFNLRTAEGAERVRSLQISSQFFEVYGTQPARGRFFKESEEREDARLAVISHGFWERHFQRDPAAIGKMISLEGVGYEVIGVAPEGFADVHIGQVDLWVPHQTAAGGGNYRGNYYITVIARLAPRATLDEAQSQLDAIQVRAVQEHPPSATAAPRLVPLRDVVVGDSPRILYALTAAAGLVLLIACFNLATMLLARAAGRQRELATRAALGGSRWRLVRQLLTESLTLAIAGGVLGLILAYFATDVLVRAAPDGLPRASEVAFDVRVFAVGAGLILLTALLSGILPALRASRRNVEATLREGARGTSASRFRLHQALTTSQIAFAVVVLAFAALLTKSYQQLLAAELGFDDANVITFDVTLPDSNYGEGEIRARFFREFLARVEALPGVEAAASTSRLPATGHFNVWTYTLAGMAEGEWELSDVRIVQGGYSDALGIRLLEGRWFDDTDRPNSAPVAVVSASLAARHWARGEALGQTMRVANAERRIVGVVADTRFDHRDDEAAITYISHEQYASDRNWALTAVVRTAGTEAGVLPAVRRELTAMDTGLAVHTVRPLSVVTAAAVARDRLAMFLMGGFGLTALALSLIGIYGVLAYLVTERTREIGIRIALGATPGRIFGGVLGRAAQLATVGVLIGGGITLLSSRWLASELYAVSPTDPAALGVVGCVAILTALAACLPPARRVMNVPPMEALRRE